MHITFSGVDHNYERSLQHIINVYFEDAMVTIENPYSADADLHVQLDIETKKSFVHVIATLMDRNKKQTNTASYEFSLSQTENQKETRKKKKHAVSHVLVQLMNEYAGRIQPWGTLTGIRPTKLYHQFLKSGHDREEISQKLRHDYLLSNEKITLLENIVKKQLQVLPDLYELKQGVSLYIGIPFCPTMCAYCTFPAYAINGKNGSVNEFLRGLHYEMEQTGKWLAEHDIPVTTIYFGGGTPTSIEAEDMDELYAHMYRVIPGMHDVREVTVEAGRPDTITPEKLDVLKKWNIHRISINPQSFEDQTLKAIGRHHSVDETIKKYQLARKHGMKNINMDLIIGLPGEGVHELEHSLEETEKLHPESLTVHTLSFKRASTMTKNKDKYQVADRHEIEKMMKLTDEWTRKHDYAPYYLYRQKNILGNLENIGYSLERQESLYNIIIMEEVQTIIGLGCGAASKWVHPETGVINRFANPKDPATYNQHYEEYTRKKLDHLQKLFGLTLST